MLLLVMRQCTWEIKRGDDDDHDDDDEDDGRKSSKSCGIAVVVYIIYGIINWGCIYTAI